MQQTSGIDPVRPRMRLSDVDTPALIIDLDAFDRNLDRMAAFASQAGVALRPHAKTHKSAIVAKCQIDRGAVGICCQKVSEAEAMVDGGIRDVLVSNEVIGERKLSRLAALARNARIGLCVDHATGVEQAGAAARRAGVELSVLVEIDVGAGRCGVAPGEPALRLAEAVAGAQGLTFGGLQAYHGAAQHYRSHDDRRVAIDGAIEAVKRTLELLDGRGLTPCSVTGAGTGTFEFESTSDAYTEIQPGSYVFSDADYARNLGKDGTPTATFEHALFVQTTVMSRPSEDRAIVDAGHKAAAVDSGMPVPLGLADVAYERPSDEHGVLTAKNGGLPSLGQKILLIPGHCDPTVNLHDHFVCVRGLDDRDEGIDDGRVEDIWPITARGAIF